jgi:hypothetical protein
MTAAGGEGASSHSARYEHAPPEQVEVRPAKHEALDQLHFGHLTFDLPAVPAERERRPHRPLVPLETRCEGAKLGDGARFCRLLPQRELLVAAGLQQSAKVLNEAMRRADLFRSVQQVLPQGLFFVVEDLYGTEQ